MYALYSSEMPHYISSVLHSTLYTPVAVVLDKSTKLRQWLTLFSFLPHCAIHQAKENLSLFLQSMHSIGPLYIKAAHYVREIGEVNACSYMLIYWQF